MYTEFDVAPLTPAIGAEILGINIATASDTAIDEIRSALLTHQVIFFRDQNITRQDHIAFARRFGDLEIHPATPSDQEDPEVLHIAYGSKSRGRENMWHSDVSWRPEPSLGSILRAIELPPLGGDTLFANMVKAYEMMPDDLRDKVEGRNAIHDFTRVFNSKRRGTAVADTPIDELRARYPLMSHPIIRTHPETRQKLVYVNGAFTSHIEGMDETESTETLNQLYALAQNPEIQCRFRWKPGSIAFWDNRACQHFAASDYFPHVRAMERVTIAGDRPFYA
jgi:taurine dioxygenase